METNVANSMLSKKCDKRTGKGGSTCRQSLPITAKNLTQSNSFCKHLRAKRKKIENR